MELQDVKIEVSIDYSFNLSASKCFAVIKHSICHGEIGFKLGLTDMVLEFKDDESENGTTAHSQLLTSNSWESLEELIKVNLYRSDEVLQQQFCKLKAARQLISATPRRACGYWSYAEGYKGIDK